MHTTILDLKKILTYHPEPHIIALTETQHRHIKYKLRTCLQSLPLQQAHQALLRGHHPRNTQIRLLDHKAPPHTSPKPTVSRYRPPHTQSRLRNPCNCSLPPTAPIESRNPHIPRHHTLATYPTNNRTPEYTDPIWGRPTCHSFPATRLLLQTLSGPPYGHTSYTPRRPTHTHLLPN
jgi:hypothetical protein